LEGNAVAAVEMAIGTGLPEDFVVQRYWFAKGPVLLTKRRGSFDLSLGPRADGQLSVFSSPIAR